ncbi:MAG: DUF6364 family protein [Acidobacteriota bacterium]
MSKLTLSVDPKVVERAKRYAKQRGLSVSEMVETYLASVSSSEQTPVPPILRSLRGSLHKAGESDYRRHLARKFK